ncbi:MAG: 5-oxoprolinase, partial [Verrucomicrobiae bacterium]|nr:5-oxoprolinase [Verrucomicrobiae bacterium]
MNSWQISADTGGTFTDCFGIPPGASLDDARLVKVLSSGKLRVSVTELIDDHTLRLEIPEGWNTPNNFFAGFQTTIADKEILAVDWDHARSELRLQAPCPKLHAPSAIDLFTGEEAPVLGARLLTGTGPRDTFPPLDFRLGTTRGTNALLERKGAPVAFFVTRGFADLLVIGDQRRPDLFALAHHRPPPLYERVIEVDERLDADGRPIMPLHSGFEIEAKSALEAGIRVAAVALLHSYRNPEHEIA